MRLTDFHLYRALMFVAAVFFGVFGLVNQLRMPEIYDPKTLRLAITCIVSVVFFATFVSSWARKNIRALVYFLVLIIFCWFQYLMYANNLHSRFVIITIIGLLSISFMFYTLKEYLWFLFIGFGVTFTVVFLVENPISPRILVFGEFALVLTISAPVAIFVHISKERLINSRNQLFHILNNSTDAFYLIDKNYKLIRFNEKAKEFLALQTQKTIEKGVYFPALLEKINKDDLEEKFERALRGERIKFEAKYEFNNQIHYRETVLSPIKNPFGQITAISIAANDISEKKNQDIAIKESQELLAAINKNINEAIYRSGHDAPMIYMNDAFLNMFGYKNRQEILEGDPAKLYKNPNDRKILGELLIEYGSLKNKEVEFKRKDGTVFWGSLSSVITKDKNGNNVFDGAIRDISTEKYAREQLDISQKVLLAINQANTLFLTNSNFDDVILQALKCLGQALNIHGIILFENNSILNRNIRATIKYEWDYNGKPSKMNNPEFQNFLMPPFFYTWHKALKKREQVFANLNNMNDELKTYFETLHIKSIFISPIFIDDFFYGFLTYEDRENYRDWNITFQEFLKNFSFGVGGAIKKEISNADLIDAKLKAEEMSKLKSSFVANITHEIRTPINAIIGLAEVISLETENDDLKNYTILIKENGKKLLNSISTVLDFSKYEANRDNLTPEIIEVKPFLEESHNFLKILANKKNLQLNLTLPTSNPKILIDKNIFEQIINNLVGNAIKFTNQGSINILLTEIDKKLRIDVADTGIGIAEEFLPKIFNPFEKENENLNKTQSSGLGLSIVKRYVQLFNGKISVTSKKNQGSTFTLEFPKQ